MTALWTAAALTQATGGVMTTPFDANGVSIDTRSLRPGDLFVALQGTSDGHAHVTAALEAGAAGVMVSRMDAAPEGAPALLVLDTLDGLTALGRAGRARFQGRVIAVTGSVGKTTTKEMLRTTLSAFGPAHAAEASYNNHWGVPLTLARLPPDAAFCIAEVGMNNPGEILPLALLASPHVAVITTIGSAHIGHMGSIEAIAEEKATLLDGMAPGGEGVLPADSEFLARLALHAPGRTLTFGRASAADAHVVSMDLAPEGTTVQAIVGGQAIAFCLAAPGAHLAVNALAVLAACHALGLDLTRAAAALERFEPGPGRGQQRRIRDGSVVLLDESYNASTASVRAALDVLRILPAARRVAVLGDMRELGSFAQDEHASLASDVARSADLLYACGPLTRILFDRVPPSLRGAHTDDAESLAPIVSAAIRPGDAVLVKGSLGSRMRVVVSALDAPVPLHSSGGPG
jgi:UDP-N-acetylmuramoyl-tripeptide--D-alanyl-D-alanine ligase